MNWKLAEEVARFLSLNFRRNFAMTVNRESRSFLNNWHMNRIVELYRHRVANYWRLTVHGKSYIAVHGTAVPNRPVRGWTVPRSVPSCMAYLRLRRLARSERNDLNWDFWPRLAVRIRILYSGCIDYCILSRFQSMPDHKYCEIARESWKAEIGIY